MKRGLAAAAAVATAAAAAVIADRYRADLRAARRRLAAIAPKTIATSYGDVEYAESGSGEPVLVIHGLLGGCDSALLGLAELLAGEHVIAPSRYGYLGSDIPVGATPAMQADAFAELLTRLGISCADVVALSAGSASALQLALRHPDRVKHLIVVSGVLPGPRRSPPRLVARLFLRGDVALWLARPHARRLLLRIVGTPRGYVLNSSDRHITAAIVDEIFPIARRAKGVDFDLTTSDPDVDTYPLEDVRVPVLLVHALDDGLAPYASARTAARRIPRARLLSVQRGGHLMLGQQTRIRSEVLAFLDSRGHTIADAIPLARVPDVSPTGDRSPR